ncbi:uncharacterized protein LOC133031245 [Cannabis sativa]|uniref:uncharacterized protein LOC133031245 n=1 Tax=Cannabis sativa TaxID=3483 RepID=UPI0029C9B92B|nr:uncharacterized protein LOC133031245 [Cannabis sativa]
MEDFLGNLREGVGLPIFAATSDVIPCGTATKIEKCLRNLWWGAFDNRKLVYTIAWSSLCKSKFNGGLGFRQIKDINSAFVLKWGWKLINDSFSLWSATMKAKYLKGASFFDVDCKTSDSRLWKAMLKYRTLLNKGIYRKIGDGRSTSIWFDAWVPTTDHKPRPLLDATQGANLVQDFINENLTWNETRITQRFGANDAKHILNIGLPAQRQEDSWLWLGEESGSYGAAVFKDCKNQIHAILASRFSATNLALSKAQMLVCGAEFAAKCKFKRVLFYCDNVAVVNSFNISPSEARHSMLEGAATRFKRTTLSLESFMLKKIRNYSNV